MKVLVTGGTGVLGPSAVAALLRRGHAARLYARHAREHASLWPSGVEAVDGSIADEAALEKAMKGCGAALHLAAVVSEREGQSFQEVNVEGTRRAVSAAERAGVGRFVYVSSLGADRGESPYHRSKREAEVIARGFRGEWCVVRPGNVYGPGDEVISLLLKMVRVLPVVPAIDGGDHEFQPVWVEDVGEALARAVDDPKVAGRTLEVAGPDRTSMNDLVDRLESVTGRSPARVPTPGFLAVLGARALELLGVRAPLDAGQVKMLEEGNVVRDPAGNALETVFGVRPTPLDEGLRKLADALPEQLPQHGVGGLVRRHVWADIAGSRLGPEALFERFLARFGDITPWHVEVGAEPGTPVEVREGATLTMSLPLRGNVQVRVDELEPLAVTLVTLEGHPLAGAVRFRLEPLAGGALRFHVEVHDRPADLIDWVVMSTVGGKLQVATWRRTVDALVEESGGEASGGVHDESETLRGEEAERVEAWAASLVARRQRALHAAAVSEAEGASKREGAT